MRTSARQLKATAACLAIGALAPAASWAGRTAAQFLELPVGARGLAMGGAQGAAADDATALYYNPAALATIGGGNVTLMHAVPFQDMTYEYAALSQGVGSIGTAALSLQYLGYPALEELDNTGASLGSFSPRDLAVGAGLGRSFGSWDLGGGLKYISSSIKATASTVAFDLGSRLRLGSLMLAGSASNIGDGLKYRSITEPLPLALRLGSSLDWKAWKLALDVVAPRDESPFLGVGAEYRLDFSRGLTFFGRAGFNSQSVTGQSASSNGLSLGIGLTGQRLQFDYAWVPGGELGDTHGFSVSGRWGGKDYARPASDSGAKKDEGGREPRAVSYPWELPSFPLPKK